MVTPIADEPRRATILDGRRVRIIRDVLVGVCIVLCVAVSAQSRKGGTTFSFPGHGDRVHSAVGDLLATYTELPSPPDQSHQYLFSVVDAAGTRLSQLRFIREIEGTWSPHGEQLYLNYFMGSTQIDCLVWSHGDTHLTSLTESLLHDRKSGPVEGSRSKPPETPENSRFELLCGGWKTAGTVSVTLEGETWAGGQFKYKFLYDLQTKSFKLDLTP